ncbi:MAG: MarR family transcriptional regulator [Solirubrobacteraceae bacterium]|jgi:DNA-binding MarR family transcriptional regulator
MNCAQDRSTEIEEIVRDLVPRASQLTRLVVRDARGVIGRTEGAILRTLSTGPRRITELADLEGLAQPTVTIVIKRLEANGWVARGRDPLDGRAVLVSLTPDGALALERFRAEYRAVLRDHVAAMSDEQVDALRDAVDALGTLVAAIQRGVDR